MKQLFDKIDELNNYYLNVWKDICNIESPTNYKKGVEAVGEYIADFSLKKGWDIKYSYQKISGNALCITINPNSKQAPVVFSGHIDTVHPLGLFGTPAVKTDDEKIYGPGVMDCKGGVVASLMAMDALTLCGFKKRPVKLIVQSDEENSSVTSNKETIKFMLDEAKSAVAFLNTEGIQKNTVVLERKGILRYRFNIKGVATHSSTCNKGANAITEASHKIIELEKLKDENGITCNCGIIEGGTVANSVAENCSFTADFRFKNSAQYNQAVDIVNKLSNKTFIEGCTCSTEKISERPAMEKSKINQELLKRMNEIYSECDLPVLTPRFCLSGSDTAYSTNAKIPTVDNVGVDGGRIHSIDEFAYLKSLAESAKRLAAVAFYI